jgi:hypothetical protein
MHASQASGRAIQQDSSKNEGTSESPIGNDDSFFFLHREHDPEDGRTNATSMNCCNGSGKDAHKCSGIVTIV